MLEDFVASVLQRNIVRFGKTPLCRGCTEQQYKIQIYFVLVFCYHLFILVVIQILMSKYKNNFICCVFLYLHCWTMSVCMMLYDDGFTPNRQVTSHFL